MFSGLKRAGTSLFQCALRGWRVVPAGTAAAALLPCSSGCSQGTVQHPPPLVGANAVTLTCFFHSCVRCVVLSIVRSPVMLADRSHFLTHGWGQILSGYWDFATSLLAPFALLSLVLHVSVTVLLRSSQVLLRLSHSPTQACGSPCTRRAMPRGVKKEHLPSKTCEVCKQPFTWRKKCELFQRHALGPACQA